MRYRIILFIYILALNACATNSNRIFTQEDIIKIYVATEFSTQEQALKIIKTYGLGNETKRRAYYNSIRILTDTPEKYDHFLSQVEQYKQEQMLIANNLNNSQK